MKKQMKAAKQSPLYVKIIAGAVVAFLLFGVVVGAIAFLL